MRATYTCFGEIIEFCLTGTMFRYGLLTRGCSTILTFELLIAWEESPRDLSRFARSSESSICLSSKSFGTEKEHWTGLPNLNSPEKRLKNATISPSRCGALQVTSIVHYSPGATSPIGSNLMEKAAKSSPSLYMNLTSAGQEISPSFFMMNFRLKVEPAGYSFSWTFALTKMPE